MTNEVPYNKEANHLPVDRLKSLLEYQVGGLDSFKIDLRRTGSFLKRVPIETTI